MSSGKATPSESASAKSETLLRLISDALPAYVSYLDHNLNYVFVNRTYEERFGLKNDEIVGWHASRVLGPSYENVRAHLEAALGGETQRFETLMRSVDGERILRVTHIPDRDETGFVRGVIVQGFDITVQKQAEDALRQSEKLAAVGRLASSIAHEINNPLESVMNLLYLARNEDDKAVLQRYLDAADVELRRVALISSQTLRFHRQATGPRALRLTELLESLLPLYRGKLENSGITVVLSSKEASPVECREGEIRQVLNNLIDNAVAALHGTGGKVLIHERDATDWRTGTRGVKVTVADDGPGITPANLAKIFEPFFTTKGIGGTGLGLWISQEIVERHQGWLRVKSKMSKGSVFVLFLPLRAS